MDEQGDTGIGDEVVHFLASRVGGHDDDGQARVRRRREVGVVHERDVGYVIGAGG